MKKRYILLVAVLSMTVLACGDDGSDGPSSAKAITAYSLDSFNGTINETAKTIAVTMPSGTDVSALVATFTTTGSNVSVEAIVQESGTTANNFNSPASYVVTAADSTTVTYTVTDNLVGVYTFSNLPGNDPFGLTFDSADNLYVVSPSANSVAMITTAGVVTSAWMSNSGNFPFNGPKGIAVDGSNNVYISNDENHNIIRRSAGPTVEVYAGITGDGGYVNGGRQFAKFKRPYGLGRYQNILYIADSVNNRIRKINLVNGVVSDFANTSIPYGVAVDTTGNVYVCSGTSGDIYKYNSAGGSPTDTYTLEPRPNSPQISAVAVTSAGNILAVDYKNHIIWQITPAGVASVFAGTPGSSGLINGPLLSAQFDSPHGIAIDSHGTIYIADSVNSRIRKISYQAD